jgi:pimeloyl-ACP methyl ester carboxylesterase
MTTLFLALSTLLAGAPPAVDSLFVKVGPNPRVVGRSPKQDRAVVLIHGLSVTVSKGKVVKPQLRIWQQHDSVLVKELARDSDVYALAYGQSISCDQIGDDPLVLEHLKGLKKAGYREIVLVGHSAGGVIARHLVEDHSDLGVTKVIQICTPNAGSRWASLATPRSVQVAFLTSLTVTSRKRILAERKDKLIPKDVQFTCVVGYSRVGVHGDGVVSCKSQWSECLQAQGIPAHTLRTSHWDAVRGAAGAELIARLVKEEQKRWDERTVRESRKKVLGH